MSVFANPELVADLTPGEASSTINNLTVEGDELVFDLLDSVSGLEGVYRKVTIDLQGNVNVSPITQDSFKLAIDFDGLTYVTDNDTIWKLEPSGELTSIYTLPEDEEYYDGYVRHTVESFFVEDNELYFVEQRINGYSDDYATFKLVKINTNLGFARVITDPYYPFGDPTDHPSINDAIRDYSYNEKPYYVFETAEVGQELWSIRGEGGARELYMVADIKEGATGSYPTSFTTFNGKMYFTANGPDGREIWQLDADGNLNQLADINPKGAAFTYYDTVGVGFHEYQAELYFYAYHINYGIELWKTDGTEAGTVMVSDAVPGEVGITELSYRSPYPFLEDVNGFYFDVEEFDGSNNNIWLTDGTDEGTKHVYSGDFYHRGEDYKVGDVTYLKIYNEIYDQSPSLLSLAIGTKVSAVELIDGLNTLEVWDTDFNGHSVLFNANNAEYGSELWVTEGTPESTRLLSDLFPGGEGSYPQYLTTLDGKVLFSANDGVSGRELWLTDGTVEGTVLVKDIAVGSDSSEPQYYYAEINGRVYFRAYTADYGHELWFTDGTASGTQLIMDVNPGPADGTLIPGGYSDGRHFPWPGVIGDLLFFVGVTSTDGEELWFSDGAESGTQMIGPIHPDTTEFNPDVEHPLSPASVKEFNGALYFLQYSAEFGTELWRYTLDPSQEEPTGVLGDRVWLDANGDGVQDRNEHGMAGVVVELQQCDGTTMATTTSDDTGSYQFTHLAGGSYQLLFQRPEDYVFSPQKAAGNYRFDSNPSVDTGLTECIAIDGVKQRRALDAGLIYDGATIP